MDPVPFIRETLLHPKTGIFKDKPIAEREALVNSIITLGRELANKLAPPDKSDG